MRRRIRSAPPPGAGRRGRDAAQPGALEVLFPRRARHAALTHCPPAWPELRSRTPAAGAARAVQWPQRARASRPRRVTTTVRDYARVDAREIRQRLRRTRTSEADPPAWLNAARDPDVADTDDPAARGAPSPAPSGAGSARAGGLLARVAFAVHRRLPEDVRAETERVFLNLLRRRYPDETWRLRTDETGRRPAGAPAAAGHVGGGLAAPADVDPLVGGGGGGARAAEDEDGVDHRRQ